jgi:hypothetical protein
MNHEEKNIAAFGQLEQAGPEKRGLGQVEGRGCLALREFLRAFSRVLGGAEIDLGDVELEIRYNLLPRFAIDLDKGGAQGLVPPY